MNTSQKRTQRYIDSILRCYKCGKCLAYCPLFEELKDETASSRGLISLMEAYNDGVIDFTERFQQYLYRCLNCGICGENCPTGVPFIKLLLATRADLVESGQFVPMDISDSPPKLLALLKDIILPQLPKESAFYTFFDRCQFPTTSLPEISSSLMAELPEVISPKGSVRHRVGYFMDPITNYLLPEQGKATIKFLREHEVEVVIPRTQHGALFWAVSFGDVALAKQLLEVNRAAFADYDLDGMITSRFDAVMWREYLPEFLLEDGETSLFPAYSLGEFAEERLDFHYDNYLALNDLKPVNCFISDPMVVILNGELTIRLLAKLMKRISQLNETVVIVDNPLCAWLVEERVGGFGDSNE